MHVDVDHKRCEGHGVCGELAPTVFRLDDEGTLHIVPEIPADQTNAVSAAVLGCPVAALRVRS